MRGQNTRQVFKTRPTDCHRKSLLEKRFWAKSDDGSERWPAEVVRGWSRPEAEPEKEDGPEKKTEEWNILIQKLRSEIHKIENSPKFNSEEPGQRNLATTLNSLLLSLEKKRDLEMKIKDSEIRKEYIESKIKIHSELLKDSEDTLEMQMNSMKVCSSAHQMFP